MIAKQAKDFLKEKINNITKQVEDIETMQSEHNNAGYLCEEENDIITDSTQAIYAALSNIEELI